MGLGAGELLMVLAAGTVSLTLMLIPLVVVVVLWKRVQRLEARLAAFDRQRGAGAGP